MAKIIIKIIIMAIKTKNFNKMELVMKTFKKITITKVELWVIF